MQCRRVGTSNQISGFAGLFESNIPKYAILSHRWGAEEFTFKDVIDGTGKSNAGYNKIRFCGKQAERDGLQYFWVDTCCIDKSSAVELQEAINSMFRWYRDAIKCYVYLPDVSRPRLDSADGSNESWKRAFRKSKWFTRGWTLQELIAPASVEFFSKEGELLGDKTSLEGDICEITRIPVKALQGSPLPDFSVAERMSWAANRETHRQEDRAYSLLGIFDVSMPLIYGEGQHKAFDRLKEELHRRTMKRNLDDLSTISPLTSSSIKRLKTLHCQSSVPSCRNSNSLDPETPVYFKDSVYSIDATTKQSLIDQLYFTKIDERLTSLTAAQGTTCRWFITKPEYTSWNDVAQKPDHSGLLWIKGNPGTGKSTLMKFLFEKTKDTAKGDPSQITLSFFFLARGTAEEKSTTGLYRSLLHQLFEKAVELRDSLEWMTADGARGIQRNGWREEALKQTLSHAVQKLGSRSLTIFVDALDECDKSQVTDMLSFFEDLCDCARETQVQLQICFSSRHYPTVIIQKGVEVTLDNQIGHMEDIKQYIKSKLRLGKSKQAESLRSEILEKSSGIFLWVVLVLDILNSEYPGRSISIKKIRERLKEIPPKLTELFEMILIRDKENPEQLQACLIWVLFATRPLKPQELYFAIQLTLSKGYSSCWDQEDIDLDQIKTFIRSSSKGLAEVTRNKASEVQFIHESVRDFLLGKYEDQCKVFFRFSSSTMDMAE
ncbi:heterokaryon incompatibility protein-domain-containing protein [Tricladium varicosporioides]|nr:heterokaryon incompatibility protein-domain-containing protein [Hymenoscyphus varicosporioides]